MTAIIVVLFSIAGTVLLGATALTAADALASTPPDATESMARVLARTARSAPPRAEEPDLRPAPLVPVT